MKKGISILGVALSLIAGSVVAETVAYRENTTLFVLPDGENEPIKIGRVTGSYAVGPEVVAFNDGSTLYTASASTGWTIYVLAKHVQSFSVTSEGTVYFRSGNNLYRGADLTREYGFAAVANGIRDYSVASMRSQTYKQVSMPTANGF